MAARRGRGTNQYTRAETLGVPKPKVSQETRQKLRQKALGRKLSPKTREKISESRKKYLLEHPDQVPYLLNHHSLGPSYPEVYWKAILDSNGIQYSEQFRIGLYSLDFAITANKIDLEIDGDQHYLDEKIVESDKRRTLYLESLGWKVIRIRWSDYQKLENKSQFIQTILDLLRV